MQIMDAARAKRAVAKRKTAGVRGQGHPTSPGAFIDYSPQDMAFMAAITTWQHKTGRRFPTWREVLRIVDGLGYKLA
jgi:hypothetical protein